MNSLFSLLPETWQSVTLADVAAVKYGKALSADNRIESGSIPVFASSGLVGK